MKKFASMHNKKELKMADVYSSESCSFHILGPGSCMQSMKSFIQQLIENVFKWDVKSDWIVVMAMKYVKYIESKKFELHWDETLYFVLKWKSKCLSTIQMYTYFSSPAVP